MQALILAWLGSWAPSAHAADAPEEPGCELSSLRDALDGAEAAFAAMNADSFDRMASRIDGELSCQTRLILPADCAVLHRVNALTSFLLDDEDATIAALRSAQLADPTIKLSSEIAPVGHPLREHFGAARMEANDTMQRLPRPAQGWLSIDGQRSRLAPEDRPFVLQQVGDNGHVLGTTYVAPGETRPDYPARPLGVRPKTVMVGSGVLLGALSAALYGGAFVARSSYNDAVAAGDEERIRNTHRTTNGLVLGSLGTLAIGSGLVISAAL